MRSIELPNALAARDRSRIDADFIPESTPTSFRN